MTNPDPSLGLFIALVHHPVRDRAGQTVTSAVTNVDVHDLARLARSYGVRGYFVVTPIAAQHALVERILDHWAHGSGAQRMPERTEALSRVRVVRSVAEAQSSIAELTGQTPRLIATAARAHAAVAVTSYEHERTALRDRPSLILFGTGHGLASALLETADAALPPIRVRSDYNHLSVRAAAAITLDRMLGER